MSRIILFVDDIGKMTDFYENIIGLKILDGGTPEFVSLNAGGCQLSLHQIPSQYLDSSLEYPARENSYVKFVFRSEDVEKDRLNLLNKGVQMKEIHRFDGIEICDGCDPEGNIFQISNRIK